MKNSCLSVDTKLIVVFFRFIQYLIDDEFQNAVYPGILFRRNGFALKVIKSYLRINILLNFVLTFEKRYCGLQIS